MARRAFTILSRLSNAFGLLRARPLQEPHHETSSPLTHDPRGQMLPAGTWFNRLSPGPSLSPVAWWCTTLRIGDLFEAH